MKGGGERARERECERERERERERGLGQDGEKDTYMIKTRKRYSRNILLKRRELRRNTRFMLEESGVSSMKIERYSWLQKREYMVKRESDLNEKFCWRGKGQMIF